MLEVKNLTFQVNENGIERSIVENISFNVEDGEMLVITGPNGGGKSTLAKVLMGIDQASAGQIRKKLDKILMGGKFAEQTVVNPTAFQKCYHLITQMQLP